jgi:hypothetical protein
MRRYGRRKPRLPKPQKLKPPRRPNDHAKKSSEGRSIMKTFEQIGELHIQDRQTIGCTDGNLNGLLSWMNYNGAHPSGKYLILVRKDDAGLMEELRVEFVEGSAPVPVVKVESSPIIWLERND